MIALEVRRAEALPLDVDVGEPAEWCADEYVEVRYSELPDYEGATVWTPLQDVQTIPTAGTALRTDIIIEPIPSNYGLVVWNGAALTIS